MATVSLSPTLSVMSSRRAPLTSNPNVVNSPLRGATALAGYAKQKRSHATVQREEAYGQPPVKKQALENGSQRPIRSPPKPTISRTHLVVQRASSTAARSTAREHLSIAAQPGARDGQNVDIEKEVWKKHYRAKFPKMVFYFERIPDDVRAKLTRRVTYFGARQEPFFSIAVTHVITMRTIPPERAQAGAENSAAKASTEPEQQHKHTRQHTAEEQPQTINPSLLDRNTAARRKLLFEFRQPHVVSQQPDEAVRRSSSSNKPRNNDVLHKAREMGKKIWSLEKFQTMLSVLLESEGHVNSASRSMRMRSQHDASKISHEPNLLHLLHNERINGPSDRDPTAVSRELVYFKGPYIYVWDMDEKQRPIMVRDYPKVANKTDGEWPQFRSVGNGRCPFIEEVDAAPEKDYRKSREREKARAAVAAAVAAKRENDPVPVLKPPKTILLAKPVTGKRTLADMDDGDRNRAAARAPTPAATGIPAKTAPAYKSEEAQSTQKAFISRATGGGRLLGGEPVASGLQPSNITSAIRSQMISSTSGINRAKAGTSKEVYGLQRKVLQKATTPASHNPSSRRLAEISADAGSSRSTNMGRQTSRTVQGQDEDCHSQRPAAAAAAAAAAEGKERTMRPQKTLKRKKELKPGYCENCQDKFRDFDEHIKSRKHRKFAENDENWTELDSLLSQLERIPKHPAGLDSDAEDTW